MGDFIRCTLVLCIVTVIAALVITITHEKTMPGIVAHKMASQRIALQQILPSGFTIIERKGTRPASPQRYWVCLRQGQLQGYVFEIQGRGYANEIHLLTGIDVNGRIMGITVLDQNETPGLGTRISERSTKRYLWNAINKPEPKLSPWFTRQFIGLTVEKPIQITANAGEWHKFTDVQQAAYRDENRISALTGATISTRTVVRALETQAFSYLQAIRTQQP